MFGILLVIVKDIATHHAISSSPVPFQLKDAIFPLTLAALNPPIFGLSFPHLSTLLQTLLHLLHLSSHLPIFSSSIFLSFHLPIFASSHLTPPSAAPHPPIFGLSLPHLSTRLQILLHLLHLFFQSSHPLIFQLPIFSFPHLPIFPSSPALLPTCPHICSIAPSSVPSSCPLKQFFLWSFFSCRNSEKNKIMAPRPPTTKNRKNR